MPDPVSAYRIEEVSVDTLRAYARNARIHSEQQIAALAASIREFGFNNPVLVADDGTILAGHGRVEAARSLGMERVPCIRLSHLDDTAARAFILADNRTADLGTWDDALLASELESLDMDGFDLALTGFDSAALGSLFQHRADTLATPTELLRGESAPEGEDAPTADDYADIGQGANNPDEGRAILFPVLAQLRRVDFQRWKSWRGKRSDRDALIALLDMVATLKEFVSINDITDIGALAGELERYNELDAAAAAASYSQTVESLPA